MIATPALYKAAAPLKGFADRQSQHEGSQPHSDLPVIRDRILRMLAPADEHGSENAVRGAQQLAARLGPDGRWPDIDYEDQARSEWKTSSHLINLLRMSVAYRVGADAGKPDAALLAKIAGALEWWLDHDPKNPNWWHNEIGAPKLLGQTALVLGGALSANQLAGIVNILKRSDWSRWTGQNLVWGCQIQILRGIVTGETQTVTQAYSRLYDEVRIGPPTGEGIMPDFSFHQHRAQFYSGGYGLGFATDVGAFVLFAWDTACQIPATNMDTYTRYLLDGEAWMTRGNIIDYSSTGREITRKGKAAVTKRSADSLTYIAKSFELDDVAHKLSTLDVPRRDEFAAFAARLDGAADAPPLTGNRHYWCSDYMVHQRPEFFASVRMFSSRLINTELINEEGKQSHHLADGCTFLYRSGDEYRDIFPVWDWSKVPGATAEQMDLLAQKGGPTYKTDAGFVGGVSDGLYGLAAQELHRESLRARKVWMMFDEGFVALGAGIDCDSDRPVATSVNQCLLRGEVVTPPNSSLVWHDDVAYVFPEKQNIHVTHGPQTGRWLDIGVGSAQPLTEQVFNLWIEHGTRVLGGSYTYFVLPGTPASALQQRAKEFRVDVLRNTPELQGVRHQKSKLLGLAFWSAGTIDDPVWQSVSVDHPCLLTLQERGRRMRLSVSNPLNQELRVNVTIGRSLKGGGGGAKSRGSTIVVDLPGGPLAGSSVVRELDLA